MVTREEPEGRLVQQSPPTPDFLALETTAVVGVSTREDSTREDSTREVDSVDKDSTREEVLIRAAVKDSTKEDSTKEDSTKDLTREDSIKAAGVPADVPTWPSLDPRDSGREPASPGTIQVSSCQYRDNTGEELPVQGQYR